MEKNTAFTEGGVCPVIPTKNEQVGPQSIPEKGTCKFLWQEQYKWYADMAYDGGKSEGGTLEKGALFLT